MFGDFSLNIVYLQLVAVCLVMLTFISLSHATFTLFSGWKNATDSKLEKITKPATSKGRKVSQFHLNFIY